MKRPAPGSSWNDRGYKGDFRGGRGYNGMSAANSPVDETNHLQEY